MKKSYVIIMVVVMALLFVGAYFTYQHLSKTMGDDIIGSQTPADDSQQEDVVQAPDFTVYDGEGNPVKLSDFKGTPVVLNFWASWCGPCKGEMPEFQQVFEEMDGKVQFLMVNATGGRETVETAKNFIASSGYTFPVFYDTNGEASTVYAVTALPTTFFIDKEGNVVTWAKGAISGDMLLQGIGMIG